MALALLARALSLRRANQRAKVLRLSAGDTFSDFGTEISPDQSVIHSSRVSQSIDALYVLSCLRDGLSLADTFTADEDYAAHAAVTCRPSDVEKLTLSSQSVSEQGRSSDAWDCFSSSLSSSGSESINLSSKDAVRCCSNCATSSIEKRKDFCLLFNSGQLISSPSPPAAIASDCCSFLKGRKSNHNKDGSRGLASQKVGRGKLAENVQRRNMSRQSNQYEEDELSTIRRNKLQDGGKMEVEGHEDEDKLQKGANVAVLIISSANAAEGEVESGELQRLLRERAMEAVAKQSGNPYLDFRASMLQMMVIAASSWDGRKCEVESGSAAVDKYTEDLLYCYLRLNAKELHDIIAEAFFDAYSQFLSM